jgi:hypothetical protein
MSLVEGPASPGWTTGLTMSLVEASSTRWPTESDPSEGHDHKDIFDMPLGIRPRGLVL